MLVGLEVSCGKFLAHMSQGLSFKFGYDLCGLNSICSYIGSVKFKCESVCDFWSGFIWLVFFGYGFFLGFV